MFQILQKTWALFLGFALISLGHGLQGTLIGVRSVLEGFSFISSGLIIAGYYVGYLTGALTIPIFLQRVGHIRVFAALASLASIAILLHSVFVHPYSWLFIRILTGISLSGIYVIMESWLNEKSTNQTRGQLLSIYMICTFIFVGAGQFLLNLSNPLEVDLFILVSILLSFALLPILLSNTEQPNTESPKYFSLKEFYIVSPLGFVAALATGLSHSAVFGYGAIYASTINLSLFQISIYMTIITASGALSQWPIGYLSDRIDRRVILIVVSFITAFLCLVFTLANFMPITIFFIVTGLFAFVCLPMYSLAVAHTNDFLQPNEIVSASATFGILIGIGSIIGPLIVSVFMEILGSFGFYIYLFFIHGLLGLFGLYRMTQRTKPRDLESQYTPLPRNISPAGMEMNPITEPTDEE